MENAGVTSGPLQALREGVDGSNGVYAYGTTSVFPNSSFQSTNYWVDVVFSASSGQVAPAMVLAAPAPPTTATATTTSTQSDVVQGMTKIVLGPDGAMSLALTRSLAHRRRLLGLGDAGAVRT